ncbi:nuclear pore complex protein Nup133-like [Amphiura filiformis]|uniref:nuclear pore complex protein Nup133-like n=1 Tax=Amphiura filiformis TaxID=82378 RepID=UPI003B20EA9E
MYTPRSGGSKGNYTPFSGGRTTRSTSRRSIGVFPGASKTRSPFNLSTTRPRSPASVGNRSLLQTSHVIEETAQYSLESFGPSLPVLISEALTLADRNTTVSVRIDESGWACVVCGRRLFVWRYKQTHVSKSTYCKELSLPPSELSHKAELVCLMPGGSDGQSVSIMAASPEGIIRHWPSVASEGAYVEVGTELDGQECFSLTQFEPYGCILATTTHQLVLLTMDSSGMQNTIECHTLKPAQGMIARVSSLIFGSQRPHSLSALRRVLAGSDTDEGRALYVLQDDVLQKWTIADAGNEKVDFVSHMDRMVKIQFAKALNLSNLEGLRVWLLDMQLAGKSLEILATAVNTSSGSKAPVMYFGIATIPTESDNPEGPGLTGFRMISLTYRYQIAEEEHLLSHNLLVSYPSSTCHVYSENLVLSLTGSNLSPSRIEFNQAGSGILGAGVCDGNAIFFSKAHGLVTIATHQAETSFLHDESVADQSSRFEQSSVLPSPIKTELPSSSVPATVGDEKTQGLKAAFLQACRQNLSQAESLVEELFPTELPSSVYQVDSALDTAVASLSQALIDDYPASDPRWAESVPHDSASSTSSLILLHQLEDKMKAHDHFVSFLKNVGIWERLHAISVRDRPLATHLLVCEHAEKLAAAMALRNKHTEHPNLIDSSIRGVLKKRGRERIPTGLTPQDVFYREVSGIQEMLESLIEQEQNSLTAELSPPDTVRMIKNVNTIIQSTLEEAWHLRLSKALVYQGRDSQHQKEFIPWTASTGPKGMRRLVTQQHMLTVGQGLPNAEDVQTRGILFQQLMEMTDLVLDGYVTQLQSIRESEGQECNRYMEVEQRYHQDRSVLIMPLVDNGQHERAASLAEKYCDFGILVRLCEQTGNEERLQRYMKQFHNQGFSDFVFKYYMDEGKRGKLLSQPFTQHAELSEFLQSHDHLSWLHDIQTKDFIKAHRTLKKLALKETLSVSKKKTLLSLSKLSALACGVARESDVDGLNAELEIILNQELLPKELIEKLTLDAEDQPVMAPWQLVELYISDSNVNANEYDFKKALDLLQYLPQDDPSYRSLVMKIWCRAILRDDWSEVQGVDPLDRYQDSIFFRTVEKAYNEGLNLQLYLPGVEELLSCGELQELSDNASFQYLLRAGYEQLERLSAE